MALVLNLFGGPGTGKSTVMAGVFSELKWRGVNCEIAPEFAKEKVWEKSINILGNQIYVFGKQYNTIFRLMGQVEAIITDSPLLLSTIYGTNETETFHELVLETFNKYNNLNIFLEREKGYNPKGRLQTEDEAKEKDVEVRELLDKYDIDYVVIPARKDSMVKIADMVMERLGEENDTIS
jgi:hypothetical protein